MSVAQLPPRKRARTQEEKEQRRVERIIRNRRAAHASREKKRRHVETLEDYVKALEKALESNRSSYLELAALVPKGTKVKPFTEVECPLDLNNNNNNTSKTEIKICEHEIKAKKEEEQEEEEEEEEQDNVKLGLVSPPSTNCEDIFKLPETDILKQEFTSLFDEEENNNNGNKIAGNDNGSLNLHNDNDIDITSLLGQETGIINDDLDSDPLFGLFESVHPAVVHL